MAKIRTQKEASRNRLHYSASITHFVQRPLSRFKLWVTCAIGLSVFYLIVEQMYNVPRWAVQRRSVEVTTTEDMSKYMTGWLVPRLLTKAQFVPTTPYQGDTIDRTVQGQVIESQGLIFKEKPLVTKYENSSPGFVTGETLSNMNLTNLKIYIYRLPEILNHDLKLCAEQNKQNEMCFDFSNDGFGKTAQSFGQVSAHDTHQFSLEVIFHERLKVSSYVTSDPRLADLFYIPYYAALNCFCTNPSNKNLDARLWDILLKENTYLTDGKPHFMMLGNSKQEMSSPSCPFLVREKYANLKYLIPETMHMTDNRLYFTSLSSHKDTILVPYPSYVHFNTPDLEVDIGYRSLFMVMVASTRSWTSSDETLRNTLISQLSESRYRYSLKYQGYFHRMPFTECRDAKTTSAVVVTDLLKKALFCLQTPGKTPTKKSFYDAILSGCLPVLFKSKVDFPFSHMLNYSDFTVYVDPADIIDKGVDIVQILRRVPRKQVKLMQKTIKVIAKYLQYGLYEGEDAFTMSLKEVVRSFGSKKFSGTPNHIQDPNDSGIEGKNKDQAQQDNIDSKPLVEKGTYSYDSYMESLPDKELTRNEEYAAIYGGKDSYQGIGNGGQLKQEGNRKEPVIEGGGGAGVKNTNTKQDDVAGKTNESSSDLVDPGAILTATDSTNINSHDLKIITNNRGNLIQNAEVDDIDQMQELAPTHSQIGPQFNKVEGQPIRLDGSLQGVNQGNAMNKIVQPINISPPSNTYVQLNNMPQQQIGGLPDPMQNLKDNLHVSPQGGRGGTLGLNMNIPGQISNTNYEPNIQERSLSNRFPKDTKPDLRKRGDPSLVQGQGNLARNWRIPDVKVGGIKVENIPAPVKELVSYRSDGTQVIVGNNGDKPIVNVAPVNPGYRSGANSAPGNIGYKKINGYKQAGNGYKQMNTAYKHISNRPYMPNNHPVNNRNGYRPNVLVYNTNQQNRNSQLKGVNKPIINNAPLVHNALQNIGYRSLIHKSLNNGYRLFSNAPENQGYRSLGSNGQPNNGYKPNARNNLEKTGYPELGLGIDKTGYKSVLQNVRNPKKGNDLANNGYQPQVVNGRENNGHRSQVNNQQGTYGYPPNVGNGYQQNNGIVPNDRNKRLGSQGNGRSQPNQVGFKGFKSNVIRNQNELLNEQNRALPMSQRGQNQISGQTMEAPNNMNRMVGPNPVKNFQQNNNLNFQGQFLSNPLQGQNLQLQKQNQYKNLQQPLLGKLFPNLRPKDVNIADNQGQYMFKDQNIPNAQKKAQYYTQNLPNRGQILQNVQNVQNGDTAWQNAQSIQTLQRNVQRPLQYIGYNSNVQKKNHDGF